MDLKEKYISFYIGKENRKKKKKNEAQISPYSGGGERLKKIQAAYYRVKIEQPLISFSKLLHFLNMILR